MISIVRGNLFDVEKGIIIHGCNALGVMGAGVAAYVRKCYPKAYQVYRDAHAHGRLTLGSCTWAQVKPELWIVNAVTQEKIGGGLQVSYEAIGRCFDLADHLTKQLEKLTSSELSLHFPKIGAGRGGGDWNLIEQAIIKNVGPDRQLFLHVVDEEPIYMVTSAGDAVHS